MAGRTGKRPKIASINPSAVDDAASILDDLPEKKKESFSLREAVTALQDQIKTALAKGYSYDDVAQLLAKKGIEISASTLKNYVPSGKRQSRSAAAAPKSPRGRKPGVARAAVLAAEEEEAPKRRGRKPGSTTAAVAAAKPGRPAKAKAAAAAPTAARRGRKRVS